MLLKLRIVLSTAAVLWLVAHPVAASSPEPDLAWSPELWRFTPGPSVRYIDFDNGDDNAAASKQHPWKHHPWDKNATGRAAACRGALTYCFRKGVAYRGVLVARESGKPGSPIRLTVDPSWGSGEAAVYGSMRIEGNWRRCSKITAPDIPDPSREKTWYIDIKEPFTPRLLCEVKNGRTYRVPIARMPNWKVTDPDDPRSEWWELTNRILEVDVYLDDTSGFRVGDPVTCTGRRDDFDENRDNIAQSRNVVTKVADDHIRIDS